MLSIIIFILVVAGMWKVFEKAGIAGWKAIIPIYNAYVLITEVAKKQWWYLLLLFIPLVNLVIMIIINIEVARMFGKSPLYGGLGLTFLGFIFYPILGFGDALYQGLYTSTDYEAEVIDETIYVDEENSDK